MNESPGNDASRVDGFFSRLTAKNWVAILGAIATLVFILQNRQRVRIDLLFLNVNAPLWIFLGSVLFIGWLIGRFSFRKR